MLIWHNLEFWTTLKWFLSPLSFQDGSKMIIFDPMFFVIIKKSMIWEYHICKNWLQNVDIQKLIKFWFFRNMPLRNFKMKAIQNCKVCNRFKLKSIPNSFNLIWKVAKTLIWLHTYVDSFTFSPKVNSFSCPQNLLGLKLGQVFWGSIIKTLTSCRSSSTGNFCLK